MNQIVLTHQYTVENYFTFSVYVHSGGFSGISNFCLSERSLKDAIISLNKLCESLSGMYQINDCDSNDYYRIVSAILFNSEYRSLCALGMWSASCTCFRGKPSSLSL